MKNGHYLDTIQTTELNELLLKQMNVSQTQHMHDQRVSTFRHVHQTHACRTFNRTVSNVNFATGAITLHPCHSANTTVSQSARLTYELLRQTITLQMTAYLGVVSSAITTRGITAAV